MIYKPKFNLKDTVYIDRKFSSLSSSFFKPIVATSLLFLLPSLGMGEDYQVSGGTGPTIKVTTSETDSSKLSWTSACSGTSSTPSCTTTGSTVTWSSDTNNTWTGTYNGSTAITSLKLVFDNADTSFVYLNTSDNSVSVNGAGNSTSAVSANFEGKNLGTSDNKINLEISFKKDLSSAKSVTISNLDTLYGNLAIGGGAMSSGKTAVENQYVYEVSLNTLDGNLTIWGSNYTLKGTVNIESALNGNIYLSSDSSPSTDANTSATSSTAALTVNFGENATMTGDIADRSNGSGGIRKDIKFAGSGVVLKGNIVSFGTSSITNDYFNTSAGNRVYFTQGDMKGYIIASTGQYDSTDTNKSNVSKKGLNVVIFGDTGSATTQTLTGGILASDIQKGNNSTDTSTIQATNVIVLADSTTLNIKSNSSDTTTVSQIADGAVVGGDDGSSTSSVGFSVTSGSIVARNYGVNEIRIYKGSTLNLDGGNGSIKSVVNDLTSNNTSVNGSALNKINFLSENGVINGSIVADNSGNKTGSNKASALIYVANNASGTITGNLTTMSSTSGSVSGRMLVILGSSNTTSVTGVNATNTGKTNSITDNSSTLTLQGSSNTITGLTTTGVTSSGGTVSGSDTAANTANLVLDSSIQYDP